MTQLSDEVVERVAGAIEQYFAHFFGARIDRDGPSPLVTLREPMGFNSLNLARAAIAAYEAKGDVVLDEG